MYKRLKFSYSHVIIKSLILGSLIFWGFVVNGPGSSNNRKFISGKVTLKNGSPAENIELRLFSDPDSFPDHPSITTFPGKNGRFKIVTNTTKSYVIEVTGDQGAGRILLPDHSPGKMQITYPVTENIVILHDNDQHFNFNFLDEVSAKINEIRKTNNDVLFFNGGDVFVRSPQSWKYNGVLMDSAWYVSRSKFMIDIFNELGCNAMVAGNNELDYVGNMTKNALSGAKFPILAANIRVTGDKVPELQPYTIVLTSTWRRIAVLGLSVGFGKEGIESEDFYTSTEKYLYLAEENDLFLALTHLGTTRDKELAKRFPQFDAIIGGHSHELISTALFENNVIIVQAGGRYHPLICDTNPNYLGVLNITLENGQVVNRTSRIMTFSHP